MNTCSSADHTAEFWKLASRMISFDNCTWWNSWYLSLVVTDKHESLIDTYIKNHFENLSENYFISQDWKRLCMIMSFFQLFHWATLKTQEHCATLEKMLFTMNVLIQYFRKSIVSKYNLLSNIYKLILYNNKLNIMLIKTFVLEFRKNEMFLTSTTAKQTLVHCMLLLLFCILIVIWSTSTQIDQKSEFSLFCRMWSSCESLIKIRVIRLLFLWCLHHTIVLKREKRRNLMSLMKFLKTYENIIVQQVKMNFKIIIASSHMILKKQQHLNDDIKISRENTSQDFHIWHWIFF